MPESERQKRIRARMPYSGHQKCVTMTHRKVTAEGQMRHRALTKRQGCLKASAQSAARRRTAERSQRVRDREFALLFKNIDFFDKLKRQSR